MEARFEFRFFDVDLEIYYRKMKELAASAWIRESEEIYLVPVMPGEINVKYRDGLIDIKELLNIHGIFEQWYPVTKIKLPAKGAALNEQVLAPMRIEDKLESDSVYEMGDLIADCIDKTPAWKIARVKKKRYSYELSGCSMEYAEVIVEGTPLQTVAVEHTDPGKIEAVLKELEMIHLPNVNYVKALNRIIWK